ncbi:MAG: hypothetical protein LBC68_02365 [Prevotellaceae bacterium]|nr:hypothetical protein [Prevotellaceae bacterium]
MLEDNKISFRSSNCCFNAQFNSLFDIIDYYEKGESFSNIRNAGRRTCLELETLCKEYILKLEKPVQIIDETPEEQKQKREDYIKSLENDFLNAIETKQIDANDILNYLSINQKVILENKFKRYSTVYSIRTTNRIRAVGFNNFVTNYLFCSDNELCKIHGLGNKSIEEAIDLKGKMKEEFLQSINLQEEDIAKINLIREKGDIMLNDFVAEFNRNNNHFPMFWILEQQLITSKNRNIDILINTFKIFQNYQFKTLDEIASIYDITRERVRQIRNDTFYGTFEITNELDGFKKTDEFVQIRQVLQREKDWAYIVELIQETHFVSQVPYDIQGFLTKEQCSFSVEFALQIIAYIFRDKFSLYGGFDVNNRDKSWKSTYLIRKEFADIFDFKKVKEEFSNKLVDSTTDYLLDIDSYIANSQSWKQFDFSKIDEITSIVKNILLHEFGLYSEDIDSNSIKIPANKERNPLDVVYEILKTKGEPMHLDEIFVEFKKIMPEHKYTQEDNADKLRPLQRHYDITFRKRSSIYLLKEWEHIRSGTIRDVIIEFLLVNDLPQTVETIAEYVLQHFPETNQKNIHSTMFSGKNFVQFQNNLFGLVNKEYPTEYEVIEQDGRRKNFEQRLTDLEKFIIENEHFPFSSSEDKEEESLCRWWHRVVNGKQTINQTQQAEVERIMTSYADFEMNKNAYEWDLNYNKFKLFILENRRVPSARGNEKFLYGWLRRAKDDFLNYRLSEEQRKKYIELAKLI